MLSGSDVCPKIGVLGTHGALVGIFITKCKRPIEGLQVGRSYSRFTICVVGLGKVRDFVTDTESLTRLGKLTEQNELDIMVLHPR